MTNNKSVKEWKKKTFQEWQDKRISNYILNSIRTIPSAIEEGDASLQEDYRHTMGFAIEASVYVYKVFAWK